jgi:adenylyl- and sulfurtransferase ThiI
MAGAWSASAIACSTLATRETEMTVILRPIIASDKDQILRWRNAPHVAEYMYTNHEIRQD